jgi:hypothetical protein
MSDDLRCVSCGKNPGHNDVGVECYECGNPWSAIDSHVVAVAESLAAHTPGPWIVGNDGQGIYVHPMGREGFTVSQPSGLDPNVTHVGAHTAEANARLIAAAPDLLATLRDSVAWLAEHAPYMSGAVEEGYAATIDGMRAAIAKATGVDR